MNDNSTQTERNAVFAVETLIEVLGKPLHEYEYDFVLVQCFNHPELDPLAEKCLTGSPEFAERNLADLKAKLGEMFLVRRAD